MEKILIEYNGWIEVDKVDLKIQKFVDGEPSLLDVDTTTMSADEVVALLKTGNAVLTSFGKTYEEDALDGGDDWIFSVVDEDEN